MACQVGVALQRDTDDLQLDNSYPATLASCRFVMTTKHSLPSIARDLPLHVATHWRAHSVGGPEIISPLLSLLRWTSSAQCVAAQLIVPGRSCQLGLVLSS